MPGNAMAILDVILYTILVVGLIISCIKRSKVLLLLSFILLDFLIFVIVRWAWYASGGSGMVYPIILMCALPVIGALIGWMALAFVQLRLKALLCAATVILTIAATILVLNEYIYGWFYSYRAGLMKQYQNVYKMDIEEKMPTALEFGIYLNSADARSQDEIADAVQAYLSSSEGTEKADDSYAKLHQSGYTDLFIDFYSKGGSARYVQYESRREGDTWSEWDKMKS